MHTPPPPYQQSPPPQPYQQSPPPLPSPPPPPLRQEAPHAGADVLALQDAMARMASRIKELETAVAEAAAAAKAPRSGGGADAYAGDGSGDGSEVVTLSAEELDNLRQSTVHMYGLVNGDEANGRVLLFPDPLPQKWDPRLAAARAKRGSWIRLVLPSYQTSEVQATGGSQIFTWWRTQAVHPKTGAVNFFWVRDKAEDGSSPAFSKFSAFGGGGGASAAERGGGGSGATLLDGATK